MSAKPITLTSAASRFCCLIDDRLADPRRVVGDGDEVGCGVAVRLQNLRCDFQVVVQRGQAGFDLGQVGIEIGQHLADLLAACR